MTRGTSFSVARGPDDADAVPPVRYGAPDNEVPAVLAVEKVLGASDDLVIFLAGMRVYSNGLEFELEARLRPGARLGDRAGIWEVLTEYHSPGRPAGQRALLGVQFADGRRGSNVEGVADGGVSLGSSRSGGGPRAAQATYFLSPLPPPGELRIICALPGAGIDETVTVVDAEEILAAAARVRELWPWEPERHDLRRPSPPAFPDGSWFSSSAQPEVD
ncbi:hypothetical protein [Nocardioides nematodiphilus]|uniref:hypothetical protein n=1 Tax=Nocardioides nematodiphilus TaxID=2849669 RepID=UPI001CD9ABE9|nr:hypothetical protein [Nocardioides nematodiphilus]MCA1982285.1 hypothetical protein [Nocardioides nematodiphilus]